MTRNLEPTRDNQLATLLETSPMVDAVIDEVDGRRIRIGDHWLTDFASCNYLGFDLEPEIMAAIDDQVRRWGTHPGWSRLLGSPRLYVDIEDQLTELLGAPDTLVLPTITHIHLSVIPALVQEGTVYVEGRAHKTIYDGARFARGLGADLVRFRDDDLDTLADHLAANTRSGPKLICIDGVNSMTGNLPNLATYVAIARRHEANLYVDDAHGFGVIGQRGPGETSPYGERGNAILAHQGISYDDVILVGGFSKSYSSLLAFIALPTELKQRLKIDAAPYLYSGPSPTASLATVLAGFDLNKRRGDEIRRTLHRLTAKVLDHLRSLGVTTPNRSGTPIIEIPLGHDQEIGAVSRKLWDAGIYATVAAYPLVPRAESGIRIQTTAAHTEADIHHLIQTLTSLAREGQAMRTSPEVCQPDVG
ncbi:8-amino-7-oxononanoate synthase [Asanoa ferruginea]|uniref:8-amino-7-oxononanoate synthase n=1 Tax=Asanoa ferruginea TaxID=53367 RepID=A0A3D9ZLS8_9ACTN|nr:pyridoxal phosphate-dependent aminotransferase family protein [Asanoa ferruginea]REF94600.1 8-amino-7-oxononanoate synthase [Asanoa ferruginea]GIF50787.1 2-amino-3-ketobutyrate CoA ligase [Asanoa ferruginea]